MEHDKITQEAFSARNQIAHEMDIDLTSGKGRRDRNYNDMVRWCENIAEVSRRFVTQTAIKMRAPEARVSSP
jgi:hypothetical protein